MASPSAIPAADEPVPGEDAKVDGTMRVEKSQTGGAAFVVAVPVE